MSEENKPIDMLQPTKKDLLYLLSLGRKITIWEAYKKISGKTDEELLNENLGGWYSAKRSLEKEGLIYEVDVESGRSKPITAYMNKYFERFTENNKTFESMFNTSKIKPIFNKYVAYFVDYILNEEILKAIPELDIINFPMILFILTSVYFKDPQHYNKILSDFSDKTKVTIQETISMYSNIFQVEITDIDQDYGCLLFYNIKEDLFKKLPIIAKRDMDFFKLIKGRTGLKEFIKNGIDIMPAELIKTMIMNQIRSGLKEIQNNDKIILEKT